MLEADSMGGGAGVARVLVRSMAATQGGEGRTEWRVQPCNVHAVKACLVTKHVAREKWYKIVQPKRYDGCTAAAFRTH